MLDSAPLVALLVADGASSAALAPAAAILNDFGVPHAWLSPEADGALPSALPAGCRAVIVASPDARAPAAVAAAFTRLPVIRVPSGDGSRPNLELLQGPGGNLPGPGRGNPFATMAIGEAGAKNAALFVVSVLALTDESVRAAWAAFRARQTETVLNGPPLTLD